MNCVSKPRVLERGCFSEKFDVPLVECFLIFRHVKSYSVEDTGQVGSYDFTSLDYDPRRKRITIVTGIPIDIKLTVDAFEVSVRETGKIVGEKKIKSLFGIEPERSDAK